MGNGAFGGTRDTSGIANVAYADDVDPQSEEIQPLVDPEVVTGINMKMLRLRLHWSFALVRHNGPCVLCMVGTAN